jgi:peptidyl-prolyl cis-trans isomerase SurA
MLARLAVSAVLALAFVLGGGTLLRAQDLDRIAAVVNDEVISFLDLDARIKMAMVVSNMPDTVENRRRLVPAVLRKMVDERLQSQEAARLKIQIGPEDIQRGIASIESQNRMAPGTLLSSLTRAGVDPAAVREQIRSDLAWLRLTLRTLQPTIRVSEEEVTDRLDSLAQQRGHPEFLLAEIVLNAEDPAQVEDSRKLGERLIEQMKGGASFQALARQFSQSASAGNGGLIGWVNEINLDEDVRASVLTLDKGAMTPLIRTGSGHTLIYVVDRRIAGGQTIADGTISLYQLFFPTPVKGPPVEQLKAKAAEMTGAARSCEDLEEIDQQIRSGRSSRIEKTTRGTLPADVQQAINGLPVGDASAPQATSDGLMVYMICSAESGQTKVGALPSRDEVRRQIEEERLSLMSKRYIRDLRRAAFVDFRL